MSHEIHTVGVFMPEGTEAEVCADIAREQKREQLDALLFGDAA